MALALDLNIVAGSVWQDSAGTIPAVVGDPVGRVDDASGGGYHATQSTSGNKPTLLEDANGHLYLDYDGSDDHLVSAYAPSQPVTFEVVVHPAATSENRYLLSHGGTSPRLRQTPGGNYEMHAGAAITGSSVVASLSVVVAVYNGASSALAVNNSDTTGNAGTNGFNQIIAGAVNTFGSNAFQGRWYRLRGNDIAFDATARSDAYGELSTLYSNPAGGGDPEPINLFASAQGQALADAQVLRQVLMQAEAQGSGAATAALQALRHLEAMAVGAGDAEAQILIERYAEATGDAAGAAQAALSIARQLSASGAGLSEAQAAMLREMMLEASAAGAGTARATLSTDTSILLAGTAAATGGAQVEPEIRRLMEARADGSSGQAAALFLQRLLSANAIASGSASASLTVGIVLRPGKMTVSVRPFYEIEAGVEPFYTIEATIREAVTS